MTARLFVAALAVALAAPALAQPRAALDLQVPADALMVPDSTGGFTFALPLARMYSADGRLLWEETGYDPARFRYLVAGSAVAPTPADSLDRGRTLADLTAADGHPADAALLDPTLPSVVVYWASWCPPCFRMKADVEALPPAIRFNYVRAEVTGVTMGPPSE